MPASEAARKSRSSRSPNTTSASISSNSAALSRLRAMALKGMSALCSWRASSPPVFAGSAGKQNHVAVLFILKNLGLENGYGSISQHRNAAARRRCVSRSDAAPIRLAVLPKPWLARHHLRRKKYLPAIFRMKIYACPFFEARADALAAAARRVPRQSLRMHFRKPNCGL